MKRFFSFLIKRLTLILIQLIILALIILTLEFILSLPVSASDDSVDMTSEDLHAIWIKNNRKHGSYTLLPFDASRPPIIIDQNTVIPPKSDIPRILIVGDSLIHGATYVNQNHVWPEVLKNQLLLDGYEVEIYRAGIAGTSTSDQYVILTQTQLLDIIQPDLLIMGIFINDTQLGTMETGGESLILYDDIFSNTGANQFTFFFKEHFPKLYAKVNTAIIEKFAGEASWLDHYGYSANRYYAKYTMSQAEFKNQVLSPLKEFLSSRGIPLIFVACEIHPFYSRQEHYWQTQFYDAIGESLAELDVTYYNLVKELLIEDKNYAFSNDTRQSEFTTSPVDRHPGHHSAQLCARKLQTALERDYPQFLPQSSQPIDGSQIIVNDYFPYELNLTQIAPNTYKINYPYANQYKGLLHWPIDEPYVKLSFQFPVNLDKVVISGNFQTAKLWTNKLNHEKSYFDSDGKLAIWDDQQFYELELLSSTQDKLKQKTQATFDVADVDITSLNLNLKTENGSATLAVIQLLPSVNEARI